MAPVLGRKGLDGELCAGLPRAAERNRPRPVIADGAPPLLVVATTGDPATPLPGARAAAEHIGPAVLLALDGERHGAYGMGRSTCVENAVARYLTDLVPPAAHTQCPREKSHR